MEKYATLTELKEEIEATWEQIKAVETEYISAKENKASQEEIDELFEMKDKLYNQVEKLTLKQMDMQKHAPKGALQKHLKEFENRNVK